MVTSIVGRNMIKKFESLRVKSYKCPAGKWTIGWGHTAGVKANMVITKAQAEQLLSQDIAVCESAVNVYQKRYNFNQNEYDSLVSFTFNLGAGNLNKLLNKGLRTKKTIADKMLAYNKANGVVMNGLKARRAEERTLFLTPVVKFFVGGVDYSKVFDPAYYSAHYKDLRDAFGADSEALFVHFLTYGMREHRQAIANFNVDAYMRYKENEDVVNMATDKDTKVLDIIKVYQHYCSYGYKENRRSC